MTRKRTARDLAHWRRQQLVHVAMAVALPTMMLWAGQRFWSTWEGEWAVVPFLYLLWLVGLPWLMWVNVRCMVHAHRIIGLLKALLRDMDRKEGTGT